MAGVYRGPWRTVGSLMLRFLPVLVLLGACGREPRTATINSDAAGLAIAGYDPVAYHLEGRAREGSAGFTHEHAGATWRFASAGHRDAFRAAPERYAPAYGGWCAYAMADGEFVDIDPERFLVTDGRLFLFYNGVLGDTLPPWQTDAANLEARADNAWRALDRGE